jgi:hypothetical protein
MTNACPVAPDRSRNAQVLNRLNHMAKIEIYCIPTCLRPNGSVQGCTVFNSRKKKKNIALHNVASTRIFWILEFVVVVVERGDFGLYDMDQRSRNNKKTERRTLRPFRLRMPRTTSSTLLPLSRGARPEMDQYIPYWVKGEIITYILALTPSDQKRSAGKLGRPSAIADHR